MGTVASHTANTSAKWCYIFLAVIAIISFVITGGVTKTANPPTQNHNLINLVNLTRSGNPTPGSWCNLLVGQVYISESCLAGLIMTL